MMQDRLCACSKIEQLGYDDSILNQFKLTLYKWNINDAMKYYKHDKFCYLYCIGGELPIDSLSTDYGCKKTDETCAFDHRYNLQDLIISNESNKHNFALILCCYLIYSNFIIVDPDRDNAAKRQIRRRSSKHKNEKKLNGKNWNNPIDKVRLLYSYAFVLSEIGSSMSDYLKSEEYYLQTLKLDNKFGYAHNGYAVLLKNRLNNSDKAEIHYKEALEYDSENATFNYNFGSFLYDVKQDYLESLEYFEKACELEHDNINANYWYGIVLYKLKKHNKCMKQLQKVLKLHELQVESSESSLSGDINDTMIDLDERDIQDINDIIFQIRKEFWVCLIVMLLICFIFVRVFVFPHVWKKLLYWYQIVVVTLDLPTEDQIETCDL